jgi:hypothetical protein
MNGALLQAAIKAIDEQRAVAETIGYSDYTLTYELPHVLLSVIVFIKLFPFFKILQFFVRLI